MMLIALIRYMRSLTRSYVGSMPSNDCVDIASIRFSRPHTHASLCIFRLRFPSGGTPKSVGLDIGAFFQDIRKAQVGAALFTLFNMVTSGFPVRDMPDWISWVQYLSFIRFAYEILLTIQFSGSEYACARPPPGEERCSISELRHVLMHDPNETIWPQILAMVGYLILYRVAGYLVLVLRQSA